MSSERRVVHPEPLHLRVIKDEEHTVEIRKDHRSISPLIRLLGVGYFDGDRDGCGPIFEGTEGLLAPASETRKSSVWARKTLHDQEYVKAAQHMLASPATPSRPCYWMQIYTRIYSSPQKKTKPPLRRERRDWRARIR